MRFILVSLAPQRNAQGALYNEDFPMGVYAQFSRALGAINLSLTFTIDRCRLCGGIDAIQEGHHGKRIRLGVLRNLR